MTDGNLQADLLKQDSITVGLNKTDPLRKSYIITFGGDTSLGDYYLKKKRYRIHYERLLENPLSFFEGVNPLIKNSDCLIVNFESVLADNPSGGIKGKAYPNWDNPSRTLDVFKQLGVSAVSLANNHTMDFGPDVMLETKRLFEQVGINCFGTGIALREASKPLKLKFKGEKSTQTVYVFAGMRASKRYHDQYKVFADNKKPGVNPLDLPEMKRKISFLREKDPDALIIVYPHWQGFDYKHVSPRIRKICDELVAAGANYIFAHGTHTYDHFREIEGGVIVYSIGQFVFNSPGRYGKFNALPYSVVVQLELTENEEGWQVRHKLYPILSDNIISSFRAELVGPHDVDKFHKFLNGEHAKSSSQQLTKDSGGCLYLSNAKATLDCLDMGEDFKKAANIIKNSVQNKKLNVYYEETYSMNRLIANEFKSLGHKVDFVNNMVSVNIKCNDILFQGTVTPSTSLMGARVLKDKGISRKLFKKAGITVAKGKIFSLKEKEQAKHFALSLPSAVVKPVNGNRAKGVTIGVKSSSDFIYAWESATKVTRRGVLVEEQFAGGIEVRCLVLDQKYIAAFMKLPPYVVGNGIDTISELTKKKNADKLNNPHLKNRLIKIDKHRLTIITKQGFDLSSIPSKNKIVLIDLKGSISAGGETLDITDDIHPSFRVTAEKVATIVPGLDMVGVDILAHDIRGELDSGRYVVIEGNTTPGIGTHHYPAYGTPRNIARRIAEYILDKHG